MKTSGEKVAESVPNGLGLQRLPFPHLLAEIEYLAGKLEAADVLRQQKLVAALNALIGPTRSRSQAPNEATQPAEWSFDGCNFRVEGDYLIVKGFRALQYGEESEPDGYSKPVGTLLAANSHVLLLQNPPRDSQQNTISFMIPLALLNGPDAARALKVMDDMAAAEAEEGGAVEEVRMGVAARVSL